MKICPKCKSRDRTKRNTCRPCKNRVARAWRSANRDKVYAAKNQQRLGSDTVKEYNRRYNRENRVGSIYSKAHNMVAVAIKNGFLERPEVCEECGCWNPNKAPIHAHHEDYSKPLEVRWLCRGCHGLAHRR